MQVGKSEIIHRKSGGLFEAAAAGYKDAIYVRGDSSVANSVKAGVLNGKDLYPDYVSTTMVEAAEALYKNPKNFLASSHGHSSGITTPPFFFLPSSSFAASSFAAALRADWSAYSQVVDD